MSWTRLLTLYIGLTTAAASAVVAAFLGGLAVGAGYGGVLASRLSPRRSLHAYIALEVSVGVAALLMPVEVSALTPILEWSYRLSCRPVQQGPSLRALGVAPLRTTRLNR